MNAKRLPRPMLEIWEREVEVVEENENKEYDFYRDESRDDQDPEVMFETVKRNELQYRCIAHIINLSAKGLSFRAIILFLQNN